MSPLLFNLFIEDIDRIWVRANLSGSVIEGQKIFTLKFADDIILLAEDEQGLTSMIEALEKFVEKNRLVVKIGEPKVMIFKEGGKNRKDEQWRYKGQMLDIVKEYKYLGVWFSTGNTMEKDIQILSGKIKKAINVVWGIYTRAKISSLRRRLFLLNAIVKSAMLYGVETWGWEKREH